MVGSALVNSGSPNTVQTYPLIFQKKTHLHIQHLRQGLEHGLQGLGVLCKGLGDLQAPARARGAELDLEGAAEKHGAGPVGAGGGRGRGGEGCRGGGAAREVPGEDAVGATKEGARATEPSEGAVHLASAIRRDVVAVVGKLCSHRDVVLAHVRNAVRNASCESIAVDGRKIAVDNWLAAPRACAGPLRRARCAGEATAAEGEAGAISGDTRAGVLHIWNADCAVAFHWQALRPLACVDAEVKHTGEGGKGRILGRGSEALAAGLCTGSTHRQVRAVVLKGPTEGQVDGASESLATGQRARQGERAVHEKALPDLPKCP